MNRYLAALIPLLLTLAPARSAGAAELEARAGSILVRLSPRDQAPEEIAALRKMFVQMPDFNGSLRTDTAIAGLTISPVASKSLPADTSGSKKVLREVFAHFEPAEVDGKYLPAMVPVHRDEWVDAPGAAGQAN